MMARVATPEERSWLGARLGAHLSPGARGIVAMDARGKVRGGVLYDVWTPNSVQMHAMVETPIAWRCLLPHIFAYPFTEAKRGVIVSAIRGSNARSLQAAKRAGFTEAHRVRDGWATGEDLVMVEMRREDCRWLKEH